MDRLRISIHPSMEWEVPGDPLDAVCSSDEEKDASAAAASLRSFLAASSTSKQQPKGNPRATYKPAAKGPDQQIT